MTVPKVTVTTSDGALGVTPATNKGRLAIVGLSSAGTAKYSIALSRVASIQTAFGQGELVEAAAAYVSTYGGPVVCVKAAQTTAGSQANLVSTSWGGTSVVSLTAAAQPVDSYECGARIVTGGTRGTAGITYQDTLDGGRTWSAVKALGTATAIAIESSGCSVDIGAGTVTAGSSVTWSAAGPSAASANITAALDALRASSHVWDIALVCGTLDAAAIAAIDTVVAAMRNYGKPRAWIGSVRLPNVGETDAQYQTAIALVVAASSTTHAAIGAGACEFPSGVSARMYRRPASWPYAFREGDSYVEQNAADTSREPLPGVTITDELGNLKYHDENNDPGLDDLRLMCLRRHEGLIGVYVNRPRLLAPVGSDFEIMPYRRVMNAVEAKLRAYFTRRLNKPVVVSAATGYLSTADRIEMEKGAYASASDLFTRPSISALFVELATDDNILSTKTVTVSASLIPLGYTEAINLSLSFYNPALSIRKV